MDVSGLITTGLGLCFNVASTLYSYGKQVKGARRDIQNLTNELFGLIGALEHVKLQQEQEAVQEGPQRRPLVYDQIADVYSKSKEGKDEITAKSFHQNTVASVLRQTVEFLRELQQSLALPKGRLNAAMHLMKWPLKESEISGHLTRLERVKTYFILSLVTDEVSQSQRTANEIAALRTLIEDASLKQQAVESRNEHQALIEWLCPVNPSSIRSSIDKTRMPGTGIWFTKNEVFSKQSASAESSCVWLNGITGAGKTTLMTAAIDELSASHEGLFDFAYFYCSFSNDGSLHMDNILGSLLAQILTDSDPVYSEVRAEYADASKRSTSKPLRLDVKALIKYIIRQAQYRSQLYLVVDGINECSEPINLLQALQEILQSTSRVKLLASSINEKGIDQAMAGMPNIYGVTISPRSIRHDVSLLVSSALENHSRLKALPQELKGEVHMKLTNGAEGMFRWVQCQLDLLSRLRTPGAVRRALESLPPTLDKTYENLLGRIHGEEDKLLARQILEILAFSLRPLDLEEVCTMLQITPGLPTPDESKALTQPEDILDICGSLLKYNQKTRIVTLAHHSVKVYLMTDPLNKASYFKLDAQEAHCNIALLCLTYLSYDAFCVKRRETGPTLYGQHPLLDYATANWALHVQEIKELREPLWSTLRYFLLSGEDGRQNFVNWVRLLVPEAENAQKTPPLYYAASYGLTNVVEYLLSLGVDVEVYGGRGDATPINIAAYRGHLDVVKLLLKHGANPLKPDDGGNETGLNAVQWAYYQRQWAVYNFFEQQGYRAVIY